MINRSLQECVFLLTEYIQHLEWDNYEDINISSGFQVVGHKINSIKLFLISISPSKAVNPNIKISCLLFVYANCKLFICFPFPLYEHLFAHYGRSRCIFCTLIRRLFFILMFTWPFLDIPTASVLCIISINVTIRLIHITIIYWFLFIIFLSSCKLRRL